MSGSKKDRKFTDTERLRMLLFLVGEYELTHIEDYGKFDSISFKANSNPRDALLSDILGLNFQKDIYNNKKSTERSRNKFVKRYLEEEGYDSWFIGDAFYEIVFDVIDDCIKKSAFPNEKDLGDLVSRVTALLRDYHTQLEKKSTYEYKKAMVVDGEQLYRRVDK